MARIAREKEVGGTAPAVNPAAAAPWPARRSSTNLAYCPPFDEPETWGEGGDDDGLT